MLIGIVGRPSVGKSTFFRAATMVDIKIASFPFTTIEPNKGISYVKIEDLAPEFDRVSNPREGYVRDGVNSEGKIVKGKWRFVPFELIDVAGLVEGASEGRGLGNQFLDDLSGADAFIHVVDMSGETNSEGQPSKNYYPGKDIKIIERELDLWYLGILQKVWKVFSRTVEMEKSSFSKAVAKQFSGLKVNEADVKYVILETGLNSEKISKWSEDDLMVFARALRMRSKPMVIAANKMDRALSKENFERIKNEFNLEIIGCYSDGELALREADKTGLIDYVPGDNGFKIIGDLNEKQKKALDGINEWMREYGNTGIQEILNKVVFNLLGMVAIFPAGSKMEDSKGNVLPDCYLMENGSTALDFAYRLHSDIGDNFIKAIDIRTKKAVGKEYKLKHRDGLEILTR
jgi:ribosome-binding ATPase